MECTRLEKHNRLYNSKQKIGCASSGHTDIQRKGYGSDHYLLISKLAISRKWTKYHKRQVRDRKAFKVHLFKEESNYDLYNKRLNLIRERTPESNDIKIEWDILKKP